MQPKKIITSLPPGAMGTDTIFHKRPLAAEEVSTKMQEVLRNLNKIDLINDEVKAFVDEKKSDIKQIAMENLSKRKMLQDGYEGMEKECFLVPDQTAGVMNFVDVDGEGEVLWSRPLFPNERQLFINNALEKNA